LATLPAAYHKFILLNPLAFIIHFTKESLLNNHFATASQYAVFVAIVFGAFALSILSYRKFIVKVAEEI
jgi:ABC-type polysaccharide/polyol phosphate export permease